VSHRAGSGNGDRVGVRIVGGLGNQLFGYAVGLELSRRNDCGLDLLVGELGERAFLLGDLELPPHVRVVRSPEDRIDHVRRRIGRLPFQRRFVSEASFAFDERVLAATPPVTLYGYFQSWRYFPTVAPEVRTLLVASGEPSGRFTALRDELDALGPFVAVQIRRGDYLRLTAHHGLAGDAYVERALRLLELPDLPLVVFTDDDTGWRPPWAIQSGARMITPAELPDPRENLLLMRYASCFIISNSSFGWWGAWLAEDPSARVIAPRPWFAIEDPDTRDLLPADWGTVDLRDL
jgi:hypothetical protein